MNRIMIIILATALCLSLTTVSPKTAYAAKVNITVTIAIGGAVGGICYFLSLKLGDTSWFQAVQTETGALLDHSQEGWKIGCPRLKLVEDGSFGCVPYVDIVTFRF